MKINRMKKSQLIDELDKLGYELKLEDLTTKDLAELSVEVDESLDIEVVKRRSKEELIKDLEVQGIEVELDSLTVPKLRKILKDTLEELENVKETDLPIESSVEEKPAKKEQYTGFETKKVTNEELMSLEKEGILYGYNPLNKMAIIKK